MYSKKKFIYINQICESDYAIWKTCVKIQDSNISNIGSNGHYYCSRWELSTYIKTIIV